MTSSLVHIRRLPDAPIAVIQLAREHRLNALDDGLISALADTADELREDASVRAVVLTGGTRMFSAGADIGTFDLLKAQDDVNRVRRVIARGSRMMQAWQSLPMLTVAAVEGGAVGGGFGLALACDWRVFARDAYAYVPEAALGLNYGWGTLPRLTALVGPARAKWIAILCRKHPAEQLEQWGVADVVAGKGEVLDAALQVAREAAAFPTLPTQLIKRSVNAYSLALAATASSGDMEDMLVCMTDREGDAARATVIQGLQRRKEGRAA